MSVPVSLDRLREEMDRFGPAAYLLTVTGDQRAHAVSVSIDWEGDELVAGAGRSTAANATERPMVSLLWAPYEMGGYSLIVDGEASVRGDSDSAKQLVVRPVKAVLHRTVASPDRSTAYSSDCVGL